MTATERPDPRTLYSQWQRGHEQPYPGRDEAMSPGADHGEDSYRGAGKLEGAVALITGGDSGIGRAVAIAFAREGAEVVISYLNVDEEEDARITADWVEKAGRRSLLLSGDLVEEAHCHALVNRTYEEFGKLDILVNNVAYQMPHQSLEDWSYAQFERVFRTNLFAMFALCQAALPRMQPGAAIINTTSIQAYQPSGHLLDYASSKSAIVGFTKALAQLAIKSGVRVNAVAPGPVWTPLIPATFDKKKVASFGKDTLYERPAQPAELAPLFVLLASPEASYVTGEVFGATGGQSPF